MVTTVDSDDKDFKLTIEVAYNGTGWDAMIVKPELSFSLVAGGLATPGEAVYALLTNEKIKDAIDYEIAKRLAKGK